MKIGKIIKIIMVIILIINSIFPQIVKAVSVNDEIKIENFGECEMHIRYWKESAGIWSYIVTTIVGYDDGEQRHYAYCMQRDKKGVGRGQAAYDVKISEMLKDEKIWRAIINGFPYKSAEELGVENEQDAYIATKQAIYSVMYDWDVDTHYKGADERGVKIFNAIKNIVNEARNGTDTPNKSNLIEIETSGEFKKEDENYYSQEFNVKSSVDMKKYTITALQGVPEGTIIRNSNNENTNEFSAGEKFKILVPISEITKNYDISIKLVGSLKTYPIFYGESYDEENQDYALTYYTYGDVEGETTMRINAYKSKITIVKKDSETNEPIEDVEFNVKYKDGEEIGNFKTDSNGIIEINNLRRGYIIFKETKTGEEYILDGTEKTVFLGYEDEETVEFGNKRKKGNISIIKVDKDNNDITLDGVVFELIDENGEIIKKLITDENGKAEATNLDIGKYTLREVSTKEEYNLEVEGKDIVIEWDKTFNLKIENEKIKGQVKVIKTSENDNLINGDKAGTPIANVKFKIYDENGNVVDTLITKSDGIAISKDLVKGKYVLKEIETGEYYELNDDDFNIEIKRDGEIVELEIGNKPKTPPEEPDEPNVPEEPPKEEVPPVEETPPIEETPVEEVPKLPVTGY